MIVKAVIIFLMLTILVCLGSGLVYLIRDKGKTDRTVKALSWRIGISLALFLLLLLGFATGILTPHSVGS